MTIDSKSTSSKNTATTKVKFTLASQSDKYPTVTANRLGISASKSKTKIKLALSSSSGSSTTVVEFRLNRFVNSTNATFVATSWPKGLRKPKVGQPCQLNVLSVQTA